MKLCNMPGCAEEKFGDELFCAEHLNELNAQGRLPYGSNWTPEGIAKFRNAVKNYKPTLADAHAAVQVLLDYAGEDINREGLKETPARVVRAMAEMLEGYTVHVPGLFKTFGGDYDQMIVVKDINFTSFCEHHLLPFEGTAHVGYIPGPIGLPKVNGVGEQIEKPVFAIIGLSKIARVVDAYAKRFQIQERLTQQVTTAFTEYLPSALGSACVIEAHHSCMGCRGVKKPNATMVTSSMTGVFLDKPEVRAEFFSCVRAS